MGPLEAVVGCSAPRRWLLGLRGRCLADFFAFKTVSNYIRDRFLDAAPVVALSYGGRGLIDACVRLVVDAPSDLELAPRVRDDLLVLEHENVPVQ